MPYSACAQQQQQQHQQQQSNNNNHHPTMQPQYNHSNNSKKKAILNSDIKVGLCLLLHIHLGVEEIIKQQHPVANF
jgi:hypothetical protein